MGNETILYYVSETSVSGGARMLKPHFWQKITLPSFVMQKEDMTLITVIIPPVYKGWKQETLLQLMREAAGKYEEHLADAQIILHREVLLLLGRPDTLSAFSQVFRSITARFLKEVFGRPHGRTQGAPSSVVLMFGELFFPEEQMRQFMELMQPYFAWINRLLILCDTNEAEHFEEAVMYDAEELYYEYGLVSQIQCKKGSVLKRGMIECGHDPVLFMDFGYPGTLPYSALRKGDVYLDIVSDEKKESLFRRKYIEISYLSPRKYLDTMVKSGYDN